MVRAAITFGRFRVFKNIRLGTSVSVAAVGVGLLLAACGGSSGASPQEIAQAERHARQEKAEKEKERRLERKLARIEEENRLAKQRRREKARRETKERANAHVTVVEVPAEPSTPSGTECGDGVTAGPETSCGFALNVREEYEAQIGEGSGSIEAWSEANEQWYSMFCTGAPHECEGAISATVYWP
jgi:hypothetical protein